MQKHVLMLTTSAFVLVSPVAASAQQSPGGPMNSSQASSKCNSSPRARRTSA